MTFIDGRLEWREHPDPEPGTGEVRVSVAAAGLNGADRLQLAGLYPAPAGVPADIPGLELAGVVDLTGPGVTRWRPGDRVMAVVAGGGQATSAVVHERHLLAVPDVFDWAQAGGFAEVFTTAHDALFTRGRLASGERVCVHGAAGGVGIAAVQLAVTAGASVVATVRNEARRSEVAAFGAEVVAPERFTEAGPFDVILELVGAPNLADDVRSLAVEGRLVVIGVGAGARAELNLLEVMNRRATVTGSTLRSRTLEEKADAARRVERQVVPHVEAGRITVPVDATFAMSDAVAAYERFATGGKLGKVVLVRD